MGDLTPDGYVRMYQERQALASIRAALHAPDAPLDALPGMVAALVADKAKAERMVKRAANLLDCLAPAGCMSCTNPQWAMMNCHKKVGGNCIACWRTHLEAEAARA